jgi:hypothetical protein
MIFFIYFIFFLSTFWMILSARLTHRLALLAFAYLGILLALLFFQKESFHQSNTPFFFLGLQVFIFYLLRRLEQQLLRRKNLIQNFALCYPKKGKSVRKQKS